MPRRRSASSPRILKADAGVLSGRGGARLCRAGAQGREGGADALRSGARASTPRIAPALVGQGEALLALGRTSRRCRAFEAALAADPALTALRSRVDVLRFRGVQQDIDGARKAARGGPARRSATRRTERRSRRRPTAPFLYRELAASSSERGDRAGALEHAQQAATLDPADARTLDADRRDPRGQRRLGEGGRGLRRGQRARADRDAATRGRRDARDGRVRRDAGGVPGDRDGADDHARRARRAARRPARATAASARAGKPVVITDIARHWAAPWILAVARAGVMEPFPEPHVPAAAVVRRGDLAQAVSRVLATHRRARSPRLAARGATRGRVSGRRARRT